MANELTEQESKNSLVKAIGETGIGPLIKPLIKEIHLFDSYVAGTTHLEDISVLGKIKVDDMLTLRREDNKFDEHAILLFAPDGRKLGYVPEKDNLIFSRLMDAGKRLSAKIKKIEKRGSFTQISIGIYLVDF